MLSFIPICYPGSTGYQSVEPYNSRHVKLALGTSVHDPTDPIGRLLYNVLAMVAEFEADLIRLRTREG
jgi:DNA invertase Pin-like site-specific DNA recombinase